MLTSDTMISAATAINNEPVRCSQLQQIQKSGQRNLTVIVGVIGFDQSCVVTLNGKFLCARHTLYY